MSEHRPRVGDGFWDGQEEPQPNGKIIWIDWAGGPVAVVEFYDSYHRRAYTFDELDGSWLSKYNYYMLNEPDFKRGFLLIENAKRLNPT